MQWSGKNKTVQWSALPLGIRTLVGHVFFFSLFPSSLSLALALSLSLVVKILCWPRLLEGEFSFVVSHSLYNHRYCPASVFFFVKDADKHHTGLGYIGEHLQSAYTENLVCYYCTHSSNVYTHSSLGVG